MISKSEEKKEAIRLRKQGKTYSEILAVIPVAKSTLSLWLREVGLSTQQHQKISAKKIAASKRGGATKKQQRIDRYESLFEKAKSEITSISKRELFLIGVVLYWAEGAKEKYERPGSGYRFGNMDPKMILLVMRWLTEVCKIPKSMIVFDLYLHRNHEYRLAQITSYWESVLDIPKGSVARVYYKNNELRPTNRKNVGETYHGLMRLSVPQSSDIVRKIAGWTEGVVKYSTK